MSIKIKVTSTDDRIDADIEASAEAIVAVGNLLGNLLTGLLIPLGGAAIAASSQRPPSPRRIEVKDGD